MRTIDTAQRRARLGVRHRLAGPTDDDPVAATRAVVALHATDPASVLLSAAARMTGDAFAAIQRALYQERSLVRLLGMRRTVFVVPADLVAVVSASSTRALLPNERRKAVALLEQGGITADGEGWLAAAEEAAVAALRVRGEATAAQLSADVAALRVKVLIDTGKAYDAPVGMSTRVLFLLAAQGRIVRGRPVGSWISSQYRWAPVESWLPGGVPNLPVEDAQAELVRRWLRAFGPATVADVKWWTGWTLGHARRALAAVGAVEVRLDDGPAVALADDLDAVPAPPPWVALLPALDPTAMGWVGRDWYLGPHKDALFDRTGNIGPTVWADGRIVGGWAQRRDGEVVHRLLEDVGADAEAAVAAAADRLRQIVGEVRVTPRFRTPLERTLSA